MSEDLPHSSGIKTRRMNPHERVVFGRKTCPTHRGLRHKPDGLAVAPLLSEDLPH